MTDEDLSKDIIEAPESSAEEKKLNNKRKFVDKFIEEGIKNSNPKRNAESHLNESINKLNKINQKYEKLVEKEQRIDELEESARGLVEKSISGSLGEQFAERKSELEENLKYWKFASIGTIFFLSASSIVIYYDITTSGATIETNFAKITLIIPISIAVWFSVSNYRRQKKLMEEYEFKARMALSLTGFREILREEQIDDESEIVAEFVRDTMGQIYTIPQKNVLNIDEGGDDPILRRQDPSRNPLDKIRL